MVSPIWRCPWNHVFFWRPPDVTTFWLVKLCLIWKMVGFLCVSRFFPRKSWRLYKLNTLGLFFPQNLGSINPNESHHGGDTKGTLCIYPSDRSSYRKKIRTRTPKAIGSMVLLYTMWAPPVVFVGL